MDHRAAHFWTAITDMLSEHVLFLNSRTRFNDLFDSQPIIQNDLSSSDIHDYVSRSIERPFNPKRSFESIARLMQMRATGKRLDKKGVENFKAGLRDRTNIYLNNAGLLSFSLTAEHPPLWGHYAAASAGLCAVFRRGTSVNSALSICAKVVYVDDRPRLRLSLFNKLSTQLMAEEPCDEVANELFFLSFLHKSSDWAYEQEARIFYPNHAFKKLSFEGNELVGFILGPSASRDLEQTLREEIRRRRPSVALHKASMSPARFRIIVPHEFAHYHSRAAA
jgi:Protein of unknown function (DUF2971)